MSYGKYIGSGKTSKTPLGVKLDRTYHTYTFNPSSANPGERLTIRIPKLNENVIIVPKTLKLTFDLNLKGSDEHGLVNNIARNLVTSKTITFGGEKLLELDFSHLYETYKDLWLTESERKNMISEGISDVSLRNLRAGKKGVVGNNQEKAINEIYGKRYCINLDHEILNDHGCFYPYALDQDFIITLKLARPDNIIFTAKKENWGYSLDNIMLEFETIHDENLARTLLSDYQNGISFLYDFVQYFKTVHTGDNKLINENINTPFRSLKGVLLLFCEEYIEGGRNSEKFVDPKISKVDISIEGLSNQIFESGYKRPLQYVEAKKFFMAEKNKICQSSDVSVYDFFFKDKFCLWIDLRSTEDNRLHGSGKKLTNTQHGIQLKITRDSVQNYDMQIFLVADAQADFMNRQLRNIYW